MKRYFITYLIWVLLITTNYFIVNGQDFIFKNFTTTNGLPNGLITCVSQSINKNIFVGTSEGFYKFNGYSFENLFIKNNLTHLKDPFIQSITSDNSGGIWLASRTSIERYNSITDSFSDLSKYRNLNFKYDLIHNLFFDENKFLWIAPDNRNPVVFNTNNNTMVSIPWKEWVYSHKYSTKTYLTVNKFVKKNKFETWLCTNVGLYSYNSANKKFSIYSYKDSIGRFWEYTDLWDDNKGNIYLNTGGNGIRKWDTHSNTLSEYELRHGPEPETNDYYFWNLIPFSDSILLAATYKGLMILNLRTGVYKINQIKIDMPFSILNGSVMYLFKDVEKSVWLCGYNSISRIDDILQGINFVKTNSENGLKINALCFNQNNNSIYYSKESDYALSELNQDNKSITILKDKNLYDVVKIIDDTNLIWIATHNKLICFNVLNGKNKIYEIPDSIFNPSLSSRKNRGYYIIDMVKQDNGELWLATNVGLFNFNKINNCFIKRNFTKLDLNEIWQIKFDRTFENIFICSRNPPLFIVYNLKINNYTSFECNNNFKNTLASSLPEGVTVTPDNKIWVITDPGGISCISKLNKSYTIKNYYVQDGLPTNIFNSITSDKKGRLWMTFSNKFCCFNPVNNSSRIFDERFGVILPDTRFFISKANNEDILLCGLDGYYRFNPDSLYNEIPSFIPEVTSFKVMNKEMLQSFTKNNFVINTDYNENFFDIEFSTKNYKLIEEAKFYYMLEGVDTSFILADNSRKISYSNLSPGLYKLHLKSKNSIGEIINSLRVLEIRIHPLFIYTWYFKTFLILVFLFLTYLLYKSKIKKVERETTLIKKMYELEAKSLRAQMNPHFIFNCMNTIQSCIVSKEYNTSIIYLSKFSKLLRSVLENSENNFIPLCDEISVNTIYVELESLRFKEEIDYSFLVDYEIEDDIILFPTLLLQPFIENAIWHGLMNKIGNKKLFVKFYIEDNRLICIIEDNGIGRIKAMEIKKNKIDSAKNESKGMDICYHRINLLNQTNSDNYHLKITDLYDNNNNPSGKRVTFNFPILYKS